MKDKMEKNIKSKNEYVLSQSEIDELLQAIEEGSKSSITSKKIKICDFKRPAILGKKSIQILYNHFETFALSLTKFFQTEYELNVKVSLKFLDQLTREEFVLCIPFPNFSSYASWLSGLVFFNLSSSSFLKGFLNRNEKNLNNIKKFDEKIFCDYIVSPCYEKIYETFSKKSKVPLPKLSDFSFEANSIFFPYSESYCEMGTLATFELCFDGMKKDTDYTMYIFFNENLLDNLGEKGLLFEGYKNKILPLEKPLGNFTVELGRCQLDDYNILSKNMVLELDKLVMNPLTIYIEGKKQFYGEAVYIDDIKGIRVINDKSNEDSENSSDFSFEKENLTNDFYNTKVFLGSAFLSKKEIEELDDGSIIELQESWSDYVLIYKDNELIAKGEVMVVDEHFGVKIKEILNRKHNPQFFKNDEKN